MSKQPKWQPPRPTISPSVVMGAAAPGAAARPAADPRAALGEAHGLFRRGRLQEAADVCRSILGGDPRNVEAMHLLGIVALQSGNPDPALGLLERANALRPDDPDLLSDLGGVLGTLGRADEAAAMFEAALAAKPSHPGANYNLGLHRLQGDRPDEAVRHFEKALKKQPGHLGALVSLGAALARQGKHERAEHLFRKALGLAPGHPQAMFNLASSLVEQERFEDAVPPFEDLVRRQPGSAAAHFHLALAYGGCAGRRDDAAGEYEATLAIDPDHFDAHNNLGNLLRDFGRLNEAMSHFEAAQRLRPDDPRVLVNIGLTYAAMNQAEAGIACYREALAIDPRIEGGYPGIVSLLQFEGRFDEAREVIDEMAVVDPDSPSVLWLLSLNDQRQGAVEKIDELRRAVADPTLEDGTQGAMRLALGNAVAQLGRYDEAFALYEQANDLFRKSADYDPDDDDRGADAIMQAFTPEAIEALVAFGSQSERPVFIVGMPRSGTTLTEQILASHGDAAGAGELSDITEIAAKLAPTARLKTDAIDLQTSVSAEAIAAACRRYEERLAEVSPTARRVTDKMPGNYNHVGLIAAMFPNARIFHCRRDPAATAFSIYNRKFAAGHHYSYDLYDIGRCYRRYRRLMAHWHAVLPGRILDVDYEETVDDLERAARRMLDHCGLSWDARVLRYYEREGRVKTASMWQVRQPIYRDSLDLWRHYERHFEPFFQGLAGEPR